MQRLMEIEKRDFPSRRRRILIGVALGATWLAWFSAFHDLFCAVAGFPVDLAPPSYIVGAVVLSTLGICWLSAAIILWCRRWQLIVALAVSLALVPWIVFQLSTFPTFVDAIWYALTMVATAVVAWLSASSLRRWVSGQLGRSSVASN